MIWNLSMSINYIISYFKPAGKKWYKPLMNCHKYAFCYKGFINVKIYDIWSIGQKFFTQFFSTIIKHYIIPCMKWNTFLYVGYHFYSCLNLKLNLCILYILDMCTSLYLYIKKVFERCIVNININVCSKLIQRLFLSSSTIVTQRDQDNFQVKTQYLGIIILL